LLDEINIVDCVVNDRLCTRFEHSVTEPGSNDHIKNVSCTWHSQIDSFFRSAVRVTHPECSIRTVQGGPEKLPRLKYAPFVQIYKVSILTAILTEALLCLKNFGVI
jgi:hypothetical protein